MEKCLIRHFPECGYELQEALNALATNVTFTGRQVRRVMVTSSHAGEGKTFVVMNLMRTLARLGYSVALVDADMRRSQIRGQYRLQLPQGKPKGLAHYLAGMCSAGEIVYETNIPNACLVPVGQLVKNSLQLLNSPRLGELLDSLAERFDYVLVDAPPVGLIIDAAQIAMKCDGALLVAQYNAVTKKALREVCRQLPVSVCPILGAIINKVETRGIESGYYYKKGYYYRYDQYYGEADPANGRGAKRKGLFRR